ncbi:MAG: VOC family protein [Actinobacteria bacterium]|nr:VOC family protein [Actinomycetota bacterium]
MSTDLGLTHVALPVADVDATAAFYARYGGMQVVHRRAEDPSTGAGAVVWLSDLTRPFVVVCIETAVTHTLGGWSHLGVAVESRAEVDRRVAEARAAGIAVDGPHDSGPPVGYWAILPDPDGHHLELAFGQEVGAAVAAANADAGERAAPDR